MVDLVKVFKSAFGAAATGFSLSAAVDSVMSNVVDPARAGLIAGGLAVVFAVKTWVLAKLETAKELVVEYTPEEVAAAKRYDEGYNPGEEFEDQV